MTKKELAVVTVITTLGFFLGVILTVTTKIGLLLFIFPLVAYFVIWLKWKEYFWKAFLLGLAFIVVIVVMFYKAAIA